jgi:hypothetical protein
MKIRFFSSILLAATLASVTSAELVPVDLNSSGDQLLTFDTASGLAWLDISQTWGTTYSGINALIQPGGAFQDFRVATASEFQALLTGAGVPLTTGLSLNDSFGLGKVEALQNLLGAKLLPMLVPPGGAPAVSRQTLGLLRWDNADDSAFGRLTIFNFGGNEMRYLAEANNTAPQNFSDPAVGVFLVRVGVPVPEPSTYACWFAISALLLVARRRFLGRNRMLKH